VGFGFVTKWSVKGRHGKQLKPSGVATDRAGNVYVVGDYPQVQKFTARGAFLTQWVGRGKPGVYSSGVATDRAGNVYVAETYPKGGHGVLATHRVEKFTADGRFFTQWTIRGAGLGSEAGSIAIDRAGNLYVGVKELIEKFTPRGKLITQWTDSGPGGLAFNATVQGIATDAAGDVYVIGGQRVTRFTSDGSFVLAWGKDIGGPGVDVCTVACFPPRGGSTSAEPGGFGFAGGGGIAIDGVGHVFVSDGFLHRVQEFSATGAYLTQFGGFGAGNGQFRSPLGLAFDARGDLYIADKNNHRIQKFGEPSSRFTLRRAGLDRKRGTGRLIANLPGIGKLTVAGKRIKGLHRTAKRAGGLTLPVIPIGDAREKLRETGRVTVKVRVTYAPTTPGNAVPATRTRRVTLVEGQ
jgi:tripartite motif-containing protein 71